MDLEPYIGRYSGETRLRRLISIAQQKQNERSRTSSNSNNYSNVSLRQRQRALDLAEHQMKKDGKVEIYRRVFGTFNNNNSNGEGGGSIIDDDLMEGRSPLDVNWMNTTETTNRDTRHILEGRLSSAQSRLHKDAIRTAYLALAEHDLRTGRDMHIIAPIIIHDCDDNDNSNGNSSSSGGKKHNNDNTNSDATATATSRTTTIATQKVSDRVLNPRTTSFTSFTDVNASLFRAMDFSTNKIQTAQIGLLILESALNAGNYVSVRDYAERTESTLKSFKSSSASTTNNNNNYDEASIVRDIGVKVQIAKGIERMVAKDYKTAALVLVPLVLKGSGDTNDNNDNNNNMKQHESSHMLYWPRVTSPQDVALYAGLMCLVTSDRSKMIALADDPEALELVPAVKELLIYYSRANYGPCMRAISGIHNTTPLSSSSSSSSTTTLSQPLLPLGGDGDGDTSSVIVDVYLTPNRWDALIQTIRENCVVDYIRPYQRVKLESLSDLFFPSSSTTTLNTTSNNTNNNSNVDSVIDTLVDLMDRKLLPSTTRLDCREKILIQKPSLQHPTVQIKLMEERIMDDSHAMLVRLACLEHDLVYRDPLAAANSSGGGGGGGRRGHSRRYRQQHRGMTGRFDGSSSEMVSGGIEDDSSDDDDDGGDGEGYFDTFHEQGRGGGDTDYDTHMVDVEAIAAAAPPAAMNPEDMY